MQHLFLSKLRLKNYRHYVDNCFDFTRKDKTAYPFICFFGPNGAGKTSILDAIGLLTTFSASGRSDQSIIESLRKYVLNIEYVPVYSSITESKQSTQMLIEGVYIMDQKEYIIQISNNGVIRNDFIFSDTKRDDTTASIAPWGSNSLPYLQRLVHSVAPDSASSLSKFQLHVTQKEKFENIISEISRYKTECTMPSGINSYDKEFCTDVIMHKKMHNINFKIHYKNMSLGEKKFCKSFSDLLNLIRSLENPVREETPMIGWPRILLIDEIERSVYWDRHITFINCLKKSFNKQQIFSTTHSGVLIPRFLKNEHDQDNELMIDLEKICAD